MTDATPPAGFYVDCLTPLIDRAEREQLRASRTAGSTLVRREGRWMLLEPGADVARPLQPAEATDAELRLIAEHVSSTERDRSLSNAERDRRYAERTGKQANEDISGAEHRRLVDEYANRFGAEDLLFRDVERFVFAAGCGIFDFHRTVRDAIECGEAVSVERWDALKARARRQWPEDLITGCRIGDPAMAWKPTKSLGRRLFDLLLRRLRRYAD